MQKGSGKIVFLVLSLAAGIMISWAVYQVPQPWRAILVAWLFVCATLGSLVVRLFKHHYDYKAKQGRRAVTRAARPAPAPPRARRFEGLEVVMSSDGGRRYTIR